MTSTLDEKLKKDMIKIMQDFPEIESIKIENHNFTLNDLLKPKVVKLSKVNLTLKPKVETKPLGLVMVTKYHPKYPIDLTPYDKEGYVSVLIHTSGKTFGGDLSPYVLKDEEGHILENIWQFSKVYPKVTAQKQPISRFQPKTIVWEYPEEIHISPKTGEVNSKYWDWREKGMNNWYAVRYPNGFNGRSSVLYSLWPNNKQGKKLDYVEARKQIYCGEYARLSPKCESFKKMKEMLEEGKNIQIIEVDGPEGGLVINEEIIREKIVDLKKSFGHGYTLAALLLGGESWMC